MPNKTKAKIRHSKLKAKAENAATGSFKKDGGIQKNKRLVTKANKLNQRKNLGLPNIAYGMKPKKGNPLTSKERIDLEKKEHANIKKQKEASKSNPQFGREEYKKMYGEYPTHDYGRKINAMNKQAYALKPVPEGNKGLSKLPTEVRNKMGYQMDSSHSFKGNVANNMKTMYMGSVYYQTQSQEEAEKQKIKNAATSQDPNTKVVVGPDGNIKTETTKIDTKDVVEDVFAENYQGGGKFKNQAEKDWYNDQIKQRTDKGMSQSEAIQDYRNTFKIGEKKKEKVGEKTVQKKVETKDLKDIPRSYETTGNFGRRQQIRGVIQGERKQKRTSIRAAKAAADRAGLKGKARREFMREQKGIAKGKQFENQSNRIAEINRQTALQESQGIIGPGEKMTQGFTPGTLKGNYDVRTDSRQSMNRGVSDFKFKSNLDPSKMNVKTPKANLSLTEMKLSPKAMLHFNRKNKK